MDDDLEPLGFVLSDAVCVELQLVISRPCDLDISDGEVSALTVYLQSFFESLVIFVGALSCPRIDLSDARVLRSKPPAYSMIFLYISYTSV